VRVSSCVICISWRSSLHTPLWRAKKAAVGITVQIFPPNRQLSRNTPSLLTAMTRLPLPRIVLPKIGARQRRLNCFAGFALLFAAVPLSQTGPWSALWTTPCILAASLLITWGAEAAQFFVAQGFALAMLACMQTLPEFAVEAILAWKQQTDYLLANLTGALRLLTGLAWPLIYLTASLVHRRRTGEPLRRIKLDAHHSVEVIGLFFPLVYALFIWWKGSLHLWDAIPLLAMYGAYLALLLKLPPEEQEGVEDLEKIPRAIVTAPRRWRIAAILGCFFVGGALIYLTAEPFLGSLVAVAAALSVPGFLVIQWLAPIISEFPELLSTFYFARQPENAGVALMNIASSNINQWTLLVAMLPSVYSLSRGAPSAFVLDSAQETELLLTIGQSFVSMLFLLNMYFSWLEAIAMFLLFAVQFVLPAFFGDEVRRYITWAFLGWAAGGLILFAIRRPKINAVSSFLHTWRENFGRRAE
jgi:cation:H+ antiporter